MSDTGSSSTPATSASTAPDVGAAPAHAASAAAPARAGDVHIERLSLRVAGLDEDAACVLARLVAQRLTPDFFRPIGAAGLDSLKVEVKQDKSGKDQPHQLAGRIADAVGRVLVHDRVFSGPEGEVPA